MATKKKDCVLDALKLAKERWEYIENSEEVTRAKLKPSIYSIGARNKRDVSYEDGELATSRVVHMPEFHCELTCGV